MLGSRVVANFATLIVYDIKGWDVEEKSSLEILNIRVWDIEMLFILLTIIFIISFKKTFAHHYM